MKKAEPFAHSDGRAAAALSLVLAAVYWYFRCRTFGPGDSAEHVLAALTWGVPHPPGFPLSVALGYLMTLLPGPPEAAVNGLSGLCHAAAAGVFYLILRRTGCRPLSALAATALMSFSELYWIYAEVAEVRALNDLLALLSVHAAIVWSEDRSQKALLALAACLGLGLGHHPTYVFILPAVGLWVWLKKAWPKGRQWTWFLGALLAAIAIPYLILGLRLSYGAPPLFNPYAITDWRDLPGLFLRTHYGGYNRMVAGTGFLGAAGFDFTRLQMQASWFLGSLWRDLSLPGLALAAAGAWTLWRKGPRPLLGLWLAWLGGTAVLFIIAASQQMIVCSLDYAQALVVKYHVLPELALFALCGPALDELLGRVRKPLAFGLIAAAVFIPLLLRPVDLSKRQPLYDYGIDLLRGSRDGDLLVLASDDSIFAMTYLQIRRPELVGSRVLLYPSHFTFLPYLRALRERHPELHVPFGTGGFSKEWDRWESLNPGRAILIEAVLRDEIRDRFPDAAPKGVWVALGGAKKAPHAALEAGGRGLLAASAGLSRADVQARTQDIYVLKAYAMNLEWYGSLLTRPADRPLVEAIRVRLRELGYER
ncbi:MAG: DUF2723 domain-containing protein [Elusimicrobiota bacterium]